MPGEKEVKSYMDVGKGQGMPKKQETKTIIIIEDEADVRNFASRVLELEGYRILQANDRKEGLRLATDSQVALVLLDLRLTGGDGWVLLEKLKGDLELSSIPVVVFIASAEASRRARAMAMGASDYLVKPVSAASLRKAIARALCPKLKTKIYSLA